MVLGKAAAENYDGFFAFFVQFLLNNRQGCIVLCQHQQVSTLSIEMKTSSGKRAVKEIFVNRELLVLFPMNCEITFLFLVKREFGNRREP